MHAPVAMAVRAGSPNYLIAGAKTRLCEVYYTTQYYSIQHSEPRVD